MLFNSLVFLGFALLFFGVWNGPARRLPPVGRQLVLVAFSFVFYGWWKIAYLALIVASGLVDYLAALAMTRWPRRRRLALGASVAANLGALAAFKYADFLAANLDSLAGLAGLECELQAQLPALLDTLPVGISFYTFQSMSYTIDVYRGRLRATRNLAGFFAYLSLFPQLVAGPIVRASSLLPQVLAPGQANEHQRREGLALVLSGYVKKVVLADNLAPYVEVAFAGGGAEGSAAYWWIVMLMFAAQIYGDFSGYTDIARGLGKWMGFDFDENFNHPYQARSLRDFWRRWHISLSSWFRDYMYIPLGGSRRGTTWGLAAMTATMLVSGLWHGAAWTFVAWGGIHAGALAIERVLRLEDRLPSPVLRVLTLVTVLLAWVMFRAESIGQAGTVVQRLLGIGAADVDWSHPLYSAFPLGLLAAFGLWEGAVHRGWHLGWFEGWRRPFTLTGLALAAVFLRGPAAQFIYFQF